MRILTFIAILLFCCTSTEESPFTPEENIEKKADFKLALDYILINEGWWVNNPLDKGKETYAGISRRYNSQWRGWEYVDLYKRQNAIKWNTYIPDSRLDFWIMDFYLDLWVREGFYNLKDQQTANYTFDFRINGVQGARLIQRSLHDVGYKVLINNKIDTNVVFYINIANKKRFLNALKKRRTIYYTNIAKRDSTQRNFLRHWLKRTKL